MTEIEKNDIVEILKKPKRERKRIKVKRVDAWWVHLEEEGSWKEEDLKLVRKYIPLHPILEKNLGDLLSNDWDGKIIDELNIIANKIEELKVLKKSKKAYITLILIINDKLMKETNQSIAKLNLEILNVLLDSIPGMAEEVLKIKIKETEEKLLRENILNIVTSL